MHVIFTMDNDFCKRNIDFVNNVNDRYMKRTFRTIENRLYGYAIERISVYKLLLEDEFEKCRLNLFIEIINTRPNMFICLSSDVIATIKLFKDLDKNPDIRLNSCNYYINLFTKDRIVVVIPEEHVSENDVFYILRKNREKLECVTINPEIPSNFTLQMQVDNTIKEEPKQQQPIKKSRFSI